MTVGILGGTGSGKSTLVQLIPRLYDVTEGTLKVGGIDVRKYDLEVLRDNVAMVLQKNTLFSVTIRELAPGKCKISLRTDPADLNASTVCALLGGGGHAAASGATVSADVEETKRVILDAIHQVRNGN